MLKTLKRVFKKNISTAAQVGLRLESEGVRENALQTQRIIEWEVYKNKGNEFLAKNDLDQAMEFYQKAISVNPEYADAYLNMGFVLMEQKDIRAAEELMEKALVLNPSMVDAYYLLGKIKHEQGELDEAIAKLNKVLELDPGFEIVYGDLCQILFKTGDTEKALKIIRRGINVNPNRADYHVYMGNLYIQTGEFSTAQQCYEKALSINSQDANILYNLGQVYVKQKNLLNARLYYEKALLINPGLSSALMELAGIAVKEKKLDEAIAIYQKLLKLDPTKSVVYLELGNVWLSLRKRDEAIACYSEVARLRPDDEAIKYLLDALKGQERDSGSYQYAEKLFDGYASNFNHHLTQVLQYEPMRLINLLTNTPGFLEKKYDVLDLGCGTGLIGASIKQYTTKLVGVDVSAKMISKAEDLNIYDRLEKAELLNMMQAEADANYDLILAGDVFLYIGKLDEVFDQVRRLLRPKGYFAFSVEALDAQEKVSSADFMKGFRLNVTARYAHTKSYIEKLAGSSQLNVRTIELDRLRKDVESSSIQGWFVVCQAP